MSTARKARRVAAAAAVITLGVVTGTTAVGSLASAQPPPVEPVSACSPGFWKTHPDSWASTGFESTELTGSVFDQAALYGLDGEPLLQSLDGGGGPGLDGAAEILLRAGVASLLNSAVPDGEFEMSSDEVVAAVNAALASADRDDMLALADELDELNNAGNCADGVEDADVTAQGPPEGVPGGPPEGVPLGPPAGVPVGPPADVPEGPPADVPVGPPADVPHGPPADVPGGPPTG